MVNFGLEEAGLSVVELSNYPERLALFQARFCGQVGLN